MFIYTAILFFHRVERYYYCKEGFRASLPGFDTPDSVKDTSKVIDLDVVRDELNTTTRQLFCFPRPRPRKFIVELL